MAYFGAYRLLAAALLGWVLSAAFVLMLVTKFHAQSLIWPASGFMVTALLFTPRARWPLALSLFAAAAFVLNAGFGRGGWAIWTGSGLANAAEGLVTAMIAARFIDLRQRAFVTLRQLLGLTLAAVSGAVAGALVLVPFGGHPGTIGAIWWTASTALGIVATVPLLIAGFARRAPTGAEPPARLIALIPAALAAFALSLAVLGYVHIPLLFVILSLTVFAAARFGLPGAGVCVLGFAAAGIVHSIGGTSPSELVGSDPLYAALGLQVFMLILLATAMPLAALLGARDQLGVLLLRRNRRLLHHITLLRMAQQLTGMGRWHLTRGGTLNWSKEMFQLHDLPQRTNPDLSEMRSRLAPSDPFWQHFEQCRDQRDQYTLEYRVVHDGGHEHVLQLRGVNEFDAAGTLEAMYGVVLDITKQRRHEDALDQARGHAVQLAAEARLEAQTDVLTGLANRRRTFDQLGTYLAQDDGTVQSLSIISIDIDFFKVVNDTYGHPVGDEVLRRVAQIACGEIRASDLIGRVGGEEFVWLMPGAPIDVARAAAERLRHAIETRSAKGGLPRVIASIGCAQWHPGDTAERLLARADRALYDAKEGGRNQVRRAA